MSRVPSDRLRIHFYDLLALTERPLSEAEEAQLAAELKRVRAMFSGEG